VSPVPLVIVAIKGRTMNKDMNRAQANILAEILLALIITTALFGTAIYWPLGAAARNTIRKHQTVHQQLPADFMGRSERSGLSAVNH
jgi:hypothetical protein